jgi:hypothetical protein
MGFKFAPTSKTIDIEGKAYTITVGDIELMEKIHGIQDVIMLPKNEDPTGYRSVYLNNKKIIDQLLGEGAAEDIFKGRAPNLVDCGRLISYITKEMSGLSNLQAHELLGETRDPVVTTTVIDNRNDTVQ